MQTLEQIEALIEGIEFRDWDYVLTVEEPDRPVLQIQFMGPNNFTGEMERQYCRKWFLSYHMTDTEIVSTALVATLMAVEHEAREEFKWDGVAVFNSHTDIHSLWESAQHGDIREPSAA